MRIWIDFENTPHVLILKPIIDELLLRDHQVIMTARDCSQTIELANFFHLNVTRISHHHGKKQINKLMGHLSRICRLMFFIRDKDVSIAISHGSRSQIIAAGLLKIPTFAMWDYEHASLAVVNWFIDRLVVPEVLANDAFDHKIDPSKIISYPGIKEDIYVGSLLQWNSALEEIPLAADKIIITMRPPAIDAHYHNHHDGSNDLFLEAIKYFSAFHNTLLIILSRTKSQQKEIQNFIRNNCNTDNIIFPHHAHNGITLIWNSDIIVGGGGTMNREAATLNVPVYSIFQGKLGAVDRYLKQMGRLNIIESREDIRKIIPKKRQRPDTPPVSENKELVNYLVDRILATGIQRPEPRCDS